MDCPFCKIIAQEIPAVKIYEDEKCYAILDINPATKGHTLLLPKEHHFILQQLPQEHFDALFLAAKKVSLAIKKAMLAEKMTWFIASGGAAGQQSPHAIIHLIPRETNDGLEMLDATGDVAKKNLPEQFFTLFPKPQQNLAQNNTEAQQEQQVQNTNQQEQQRHNTQQEQQHHDIHEQKQVTQDVATHKQTQETNTQERLSALLSMLQEEPKLHELLLQDPQTFELLAQKNPVLQQAFAGINLQELSNMLRKMHETKSTTTKEPVNVKQHTTKDSSIKQETIANTHAQQLQTNDVHTQQSQTSRAQTNNTQIHNTQTHDTQNNHVQNDHAQTNYAQTTQATPADEHADVPFAKDLNDEQLHAFLLERPKLQALLHDDTLLEQIEINPRLAKFFTQTTPKEVATRLDSYTKKIAKQHDAKQKHTKEPIQEQHEAQDDTLDFALLAKHLK